VKPTRTYVDSGVLIAAARGKGRLYEHAIAIISDVANREFVCSDYVKLEVVPKATHFGQEPEVRFYNQFFLGTSAWLPFKVEDLVSAFAEACVSGLSAMDAVHVVVASAAGCDELVTSEKAGAAIHRTKLLPVKTIDDA
jgi:predicted nucleic acid-binding protein